MKVSFVHKGHMIVFQRNVFVAEMYIDGKICDNKKGGVVDLQAKPFDLSGSFTDENNETVNVRLHCEPKTVKDEVSLYVNEELIETTAG